MRNTAPAAYTAVPIGVAVCSGHVPGILPVTFAGLSVTFPESPVTLGRNTQEDGADTFDVYISWADLKTLLALPAQTTRIREPAAQAIRTYLGTAKFQGYAAHYELEEERVFFNVVPLFVNAAAKLVPLIKHLVSPRSMEGKTYLTLFQHVLPADTTNHEVNCGPIALMP